MQMLFFWLLDVFSRVAEKLLQECYNFLLGPVAQLVEQRIENPRVGSSILPQATRYTP
jgi:hypothetical protein